MPVERSPLQLALLLSTTIFVGETVASFLMLALPQVAPLLRACLDASLGLVLMAPAIYFLFILPMRRHVQERDEATLILERTRGQLEERVRDRTAELAKASQDVTGSLQALEKAHREHLLLGELIELLQTCRVTKESESMLKQFAGKLFPAENGAIYVYRASRNLLELATSWGNEPKVPEMFSPEDCWALRRGRQHLIEAEGASPRCRHLKDLSTSGASLCVPMMAHGDATGVLVLQSAPSADSSIGMSADTRRLAARAAEQVALTLANLHLRDELRDQAIRDPLTGMFNRRYFQETADRELRRAEQQGASAAVIVIDIDHFKRFNDTHGHEAGDAVLKKVGLLLQNSTRIEDIACRYGGEEFVLLMPGAREETVVCRAKQIMEAVRELDVRYKGETLRSLTISCGVAVFPNHGHNWSDLTEAADRALFESKRAGRDRVTVAP